jgi:hypothetical protein
MAYRKRKKSSICQVLSHIIQYSVGNSLDVVRQLIQNIVLRMQTCVMFLAWRIVLSEFVLKLPS